MPINREEVREFFNGLACKWDSYAPAEDWIVTKIFTNIGSIQNQTVLDVGCGTGFLVPYYIQGNVGDLDCIDIAEQMIDVARSKFDYANVNFICEDILEYQAERKYDLIKTSRTVANDSPVFPLFKTAQAGHRQPFFSKWHLRACWDIPSP